MNSAESDKLWKLTILIKIIEGNRLRWLGLWHDGRKWEYQEELRLQTWLKMERTDWYLAKWTLRLCGK